MEVFVYVLMMGPLVLLSLGVVIAVDGWQSYREQRAAHLASLEDEVRRLRQECKVAYADGYDNGYKDGYQEREWAEFFLGQDTKPQQDDCPPFGMDRFPTDLI